MTTRPKAPHGNKIQMTRGHGLLEFFLARQRARTADRLIPLYLREGRILDIGCGAYPLFLSTINFAQKYGLENFSRDPSLSLTGEPDPSETVKFIDFDLRKTGLLPFENNYFDAVTMLAVVEHLVPDYLRHWFGEIYRILKGGGIFTITTPSFWTGPILKVLSFAGMISREEIVEHKHLYTSAQLTALLQSAGFSHTGTKCGYFEAGLNTWATAMKVAEKKTD